MDFVPDSLKSKKTIIAERDQLKGDLAQQKNEYDTKFAEQQATYESKLSEAKQKCELFARVYQGVRDEFDDSKDDMNELTTENERLTTENKKLHEVIDNLYKQYVPAPMFNPNAISVHGSAKQGTEYFVSLSAA